MKMKMMMTVGSIAGRLEDLMVGGSSVLCEKICSQASCKMIHIDKQTVRMLLVAVNLLDLRVKMDMQDFWIIRVSSRSASSILIIPTCNRNHIYKPFCYSLCWELGVYCKRPSFWCNFFAVATKWKFVRCLLCLFSCVVVYLLLVSE